jgi:DNA-binding CsgD family transcriptional regulator
VLGTTLSVAGRLEEGRRLLWAALGARDEHLAAGLRAGAVQWYARSSRLLGRYDRAGSAVDRYLAGTSGAGVDDHALRLEHGTIALSRGTVDRDWERRTTRIAAHPDTSLRAQALGQLALVLTGRRRRAEAVELVRTAGHLADRSPERGRDAVARALESLYWLGEAERSLGLTDRAAEHYGRALAICDRQGHEYLRGFLAVGLGRVGMAVGDAAAAATWAERARAAAEVTGSDPGRAAALALRSQALLATGETAAAERAATAAVELADPFADNWARYARRCLGRARGEQPTGAVPLPRRPADAPGTRTGPGSAGGAGPDGTLRVLSRREWEIADLVSAGRTNQQIASALTLSPKTVETYLARIFRKLGITSRTSIAHLVGRAGAGQSSTDRPVGGTSPAGTSIQTADAAPSRQPSSV